MRYQNVIDWFVMFFLFSTTLINMIWNSDVFQLKFWMGVLLFNCLLAIFFKMKFANLAHDAIELAKITNELLRRERKK